MPRPTQSQIDVGTDFGPDRYRIGRDPRRTSRDELRQIGHQPKSPLRALRDHCLDYSAGSPGEQGRRLGARMRQKSIAALNQKGSGNDPAAATGAADPQHRGETVSPECPGTPGDDHGA